MHRCYANAKGVDTVEGNPSGQTLQPASNHHKRKASGQSPSFEDLLGEDERKARQKLDSSKKNSLKREFVTLGGPLPSHPKRVKLPPSLEQRFFGTSRSSSSA